MENDNKEFNMTQSMDHIQQKLKQWVFYLIVFALSLTVLIVLPMIQTGGDQPYIDLPSTVGGWIEYLSVRIGVSAINLFIYICFLQQGKLNVINHPNYIKAQEMLNTAKVKELKPRSPKVFKARAYGGKSVSLMISSAIALVTFPPVVYYDWRMALIYLMTISVAVCFGIYQMKVSEAYWSEEYLRYAIYVKEREQQESPNGEEMEVTNA